MGSKLHTMSYIFIITYTKWWRYISYVYNHSLHKHKEVFFFGRLEVMYVHTYVCAGSSVLELWVGEGESLKLCLVERPDRVSIDRSQGWILRDKVRVKVTEITLGSLQQDTQHEQCSIQLKLWTVSDINSDHCWHTHHLSHTHDTQNYESSKGQSQIDTCNSYW